VASTGEEAMEPAVLLVHLLALLGEEAGAPVAARPDVGQVHAPPPALVGTVAVGLVAAQVVVEPVEVSAWV